MAVINESYGEREKWMGEVFTQTFNCHVPGKRGELPKKKVQHAKKTRIPKNSGKDRTLKEEKEGP